MTPSSEVGDGFEFELLGVFFLPDGGRSPEPVDDGVRCPADGSTGTLAAADSARNATGVPVPPPLAPPAVKPLAPRGLGSL